jgi:hypothetical protein
MNTTTTKIAGEAMTDERATFNEFRAALCRMNDANTPVSVADRVMILSNATFLLDEYARALLASKQAAPMHPTEAMLNAARDWSLKKYGQGIGSDAAIGCWQAMLAASPTAPAQSCGDAEQADEADGYKLAGYLVDPGAGSAMDRFQTWKPDAVQLADVQRRGGSVTELFARAKDSK